MACRPFNLGNGVTGIMCGPRGKVHTCSAPGCHRGGSKQCDYPVKTAKGTCSVYLCDRHAASAGSGLDHCPAHARLAKQKELLP